MPIPDATNLRMLKAAGAVLARTEAGTFWAIFDKAYLEAAGASGVDTRQPVLTCRTSDVSRLEIVKDTSIEVVGETYRMKRHEPDGTGMSQLFLKR